MAYTVGEAAKQINVATSTLRYYDKEGLLPFVERSDGGIRLFKPEDISMLKTIECLKKTGMPIKEIKHFIDCCVEGDAKIAERLAIITDQQASVIAQMQELQDMLDMLDFKRWYYETAQSAGTCAVHDDLSLTRVPEKFHKYLNKMPEQA
ncbi:MAG: MerR family transcriptional regulator [Clostridia bacterium]|nr:MerR family transcriptional regulator [Clostridia bacterium]